MSNLSITPAKLEIQLQPGSSYVQSYVIKNNDTQSIVLNSSVENWTPQGSDGNVSYLNSSSDLNFSLSNTDLKLGQSYVINPGQSKQLVLKIQVPSNILLKDYYSTFFVNQSTIADLSGNSTQLIKLGSHLLISVSRVELPITKFTVSNFKTNSPIIDCFFSPLKFSGQILNQSDYFSQIDKSIVITKNNIEITKLTIFPDNVLAHHSRNIRCINKNQPADCQLQKPLWPGFYQATIDKQSINFIVLPYSLFVLGIVLSLIIKVLIDFYKRRKL